MKQLLEEIPHNKLLWLPACLPMVFAVAKLEPEAHTLLFVLSVLAIVPLAALLIPSAGRAVSSCDDRRVCVKFFEHSCGGHVIVVWVRSNHSG